MAALSEFKVEATDTTNPTNKVTVKFVKATADFSNDVKPLEPEFQSESRKKKEGDKRTYGPVAMAIDGNDDTAWGIDAGPGRRNVPRKAVFVPEKPVEFPNGAILDFRLAQNHGGDNSDDNQNHNLGRFRLSVTRDTNAVADPLPAGVREIFKTPRQQRSPSQVATVFSYWRTTVPEFKEANEKIDALWRQWPEGSPTQTLVARADRGPGDDRRPTHMFKRGDWLKPDKEVNAGVPSFLHPLPAGADDSRLTFARWLMDRKSPTTARVFVNRMWQQYFWNRDRGDGRGFRYAIGRAFASATARLAGVRVHGPRLEHQGDAPAHRELGNVPAIVPCHSGAAREGPLQPAAGAWSAIPRRG
jgi:hypothetical protein